MEKLMKKYKKSSVSDLEPQDFMEALPSVVRKKVSVEDLEKVGEIQKEYGFTRNELLDSIVKFSDILEKRDVDFDRFVKALMYVNFIACGDNKTKAYKKVFPERLFDRDGNRIDEDRVYTKANMYYRGDLVQSLLKLVQIPNHLLFYNERMNAMKIAVDLMENAKSEKVKIEAVRVVLDNTKPPEEIMVNVKDNRSEELMNRLREMAELQARAILEGKKPDEIINVEISDD